MARRCAVTGKGVQVGHIVSHANNKSKRTFRPNLRSIVLASDALGRGIRLKLSAHGLKSVEHVGGIDNWLLKTSDAKLSFEAQRAKRAIRKALAKVAAA
jgi:large subunit ribosomal protein L28